MKTASFFHVLRMHIRQAFFHRTAALGVIFSWALRVGLTMLLYRGIYHLIGEESVKGINFDIAASSMMLYAIYAAFGGREMFWSINDEYRSGGMEVWLNKPVSYLAMKMAQVVSKDIPATLSLFVCMTAFWSIHGLPQTDHTVLRLISGAFLLFFGVVISFFLYGIMGMSAIWLQDAKPVFSTGDKLIMVFGGIYIPIAFFPPWFRLLGESLPIGATSFVSQIFYPDFFSHLPRFLAVQIIWIILLALSLHRINRAAKSRMTVNGG